MLDENDRRAARAPPQGERRPAPLFLRELRAPFLADRKFVTTWAARSGSHFALRRLETPMDSRTLDQQLTESKGPLRVFCGWDREERPWPTT
jgi:hypothetical protein